MPKIALICIVVSLAGGSAQAFPGSEAIKVYNESRRPLISLDIIKTIESGGNPLAYNRGSGARGLYQITDICRREYNNFHKGEEISQEELFIPEVNERIAKWYIRDRIPQMLRHYGREVSLENVLISYNAGIAYVVEERELPRETVNYIEKYKRGGM